MQKEDLTYICNMKLSKHVVSNQFVRAFVLILLLRVMLFFQFPKYFLISKLEIQRSEDRDQLKLAKENLQLSTCRLSIP